MARNHLVFSAFARRRFPVRVVSPIFPVILVVLLGALALAPTPSVSSQSTLPPGFTDTLLTNVLNLPTSMAFAPDGRIFVCQQSGQLRIFKNDALLPAPFLSVPVSQEGERGLLGVAFDPDFATNQYVYVYYTKQSPINNRVSRFTANGDVAVPAARPSSSNSTT